MYNTTVLGVKGGENMDDLKISGIEIRYERMGERESTRMDGLCHEKVLPWLSVAQAETGSYDIRLGKKTGSMRNTGEGGFFIAPSNVLQTIIHRSNKESGVMKIRWIFLDVVINGRHRPDQLFDLPVVLGKEGKVKMNALFDELFSCEDICDRYSTYYQIIKLILSLGKRKRRTDNKAMASVMDYISENYDKPITVKELSEIAYMSESNFYTVFKRQFSLSPLSYINHYRLSAAAELLLSTDARISDISDDVGFSDPLYFSRMFKKTYSVSPREYRKINGNK